jgi:hypothetical protein
MLRVAGKIPLVLDWHAHVRVLSSVLFCLYDPLAGKTTLPNFTLSSNSYASNLSLIGTPSMSRLPSLSIAAAALVVQ